MDSEAIQFEELIQGLIDNAFGCCNDFLSPETVVGLRNNLHRLSEAGKLKESGIGNQSKFQFNSHIRGDKINWIEAISQDPFEMLYLAKVSKFISHLNKTCYTSIASFESHYASYEKGSMYKRHVDQFKSEQGRKFSIVLYLNDDWKSEDGGALSLHPRDQEVVHITPIGGRMVFFRSDEMSHEVNASPTRDRSSIAGWMKN